MNTASQHLFRVSLLVVVSVLAACTSTSDATTVPTSSEPPSTSAPSSTTTLPPADSPTVRETTVRAALDAIFASDFETLLRLSLPEDAALLEALEAAEPTAPPLLGRLSQNLIVAFGPLGSQSILVEEGENDGDWVQVDVKSGVQGAGIVVMIDNTTDRIDLIATFAAYVAADLERAASESPIVLDALAQRAASLEAADRLAFEPLRDDQAAMDRLLILVSAA